MKIPECATNDACPMGYQCFVAEKCLGAAQQNAQASQDNCSKYYPIPGGFYEGWKRVEMTASDLGIVDQLLDDKVGMDAP